VAEGQAVVEALKTWEKSCRITWSSMVMHLLDDATMHNRLDITNFTKKQLKLNIY